MLWFICFKNIHFIIIHNSSCFLVSITSDNRDKYLQIYYVILVLAINADDCLCYCKLYIFLYLGICVYCKEQKAHLYEGHVQMYFFFFNYILHKEQISLYWFYSGNYQHSVSWSRAVYGFGVLHTNFLLQWCLTCMSLIQRLLPLTNILVHARKRQGQFRRWEITVSSPINLCKSPEIIIMSWAATKTDIQRLTNWCWPIFQSLLWVSQIGTCSHAT